MKRTLPKPRLKPVPEPGFARMDAHCHLDHMANADELARLALERNLGICCATVSPADHEAARARFAGLPNVCVGVGLHPYWLADGRCDGTDVDRLVLQLKDTPFVGEVGLDFSGKRAGSRPLQVAAFESIVRACAEHPLQGRVLSIHAVRAADVALDILECFDLPRHAPCIFHWFSGTSDDLARARRLGCYFSVNDYMLNAKRGREYARIIPQERLLIETDQPDAFDEPYSMEAWEASLSSVTARMAQIRGCDADALEQAMAATSNRLFAACFPRGER